MMRIMARRTKVATLQAWRSKSRASLRLRLIHANVRFTYDSLDSLQVALVPIGAFPPRFLLTTCCDLCRIEVNISRVIPQGEKGGCPGQC